jgi:hypothetical protein
VPYSGEDGYPAGRIKRFLLGPFFGGAIFLALLVLWLIFGSRLLNSPRRIVLYFPVLGLWAIGWIVVTLLRRALRRDK